MISIHVKEGKLFIDDQEREIIDLKQDFLDEVVSESLRDQVNYQLEGDHPLVKFFQTLQDETKEGSALRQKFEEMEAARAADKVNEKEMSELTDRE